MMSFASILVALHLSLPFAVAAQGTPEVALTGSRAPWVDRATKIGPADDATEVDIAVYLRLRNESELKSLVHDVSTPGSSKYGEFLTPEQFRATFAPDPADVKQVQDMLRDSGFSVGYTPASGFYVSATGSVAQIKAAFHVTQDLYSYAGKTLRANSESPTVPAAIVDKITWISGLDDTRSLATVPQAHKGPAPPLARPASLAGAPPVPEPAYCSTYWDENLTYIGPAPAPYPNVVPWFICGYTPAQLREAYGANKVSQTGRAVRVAIVGTYASPTIFADVNRFSSHYGLPQISFLNFNQIIPPGIYNVPASDPCGPQLWYEEETLDIEAVHGMAPDAYLIYAGAGCLTGPDLNQTLYNLIDNRLADVISNGWLLYGGEQTVSSGQLKTDTDQFLQAAAEGITLVFPSGDYGDDLALDDSISGGNWPNGSPYVTVVGGTTLGLLNSSGKKSEWGWSGYINYLKSPEILDSDHLVIDSGLMDSQFSFFGGSGGGPSLVELQPDYQKGIVPASMSEVGYTLGGIPIALEPARRVTPDVAMDGDPYTGVLSGETFTITGSPAYDTGCTKLTSITQYCERTNGGTSASAPLFAGVLALLDEARISSLLSPVGFANPALYKLNTAGEGSTAPIIDIIAPATPMAIASAFFDVPGFVPVVSVNSAPKPGNTGVIEGQDTTLRTVPKYDNVTGLGVPNIPYFIRALTSK